jgi:uncharacterized protein (TIGR03083 family)
MQTTTTVLGEARAAIKSVACRTADLLGSLPSAIVPIPGSEWTVRDAAVHLANYSAIYSEIANGVLSPIKGLVDAHSRPVRNGVHYRDAIALNSARRLADVPETDPAKLAKLVLDGARRLIDTTAGRPDDQPVSFHCGFPFTLAGLVCSDLAEHILHGYDIATAVGLPYPIDPAHAALVVAGVAPLFALCLNPETTEGLTVAYEVDLRGAGRSLVRFVDGDYRLEPADSGPVDCIISVDPVAYMLVGAGRISRSSAIALGLISANGARPELALRFNDLFIYP